jgi:type I restriction enzyme, S subunit
MELMDSWKQINLGKSATLKARIGWQGLTTAEYLSSGDYFLVTGTDFLNGFIDWNNCVHVDKERYEQDKYIQLQVDDILVTKDGTIGKVAIIDKIVKPTTLNSGVFVIRPYRKSFYQKYLYYILRSEHFADFLSKLMAGSTINHLYQKDFIHYTFPAPPTLEEQKKIANTLSDTDSLIQYLKTLIIKKKAIKEGAIQDLLTGKRRLHDFTENEGIKQTEIGIIPEDWDLVNFEEIADSKVKWSITGGPFGSNLKTSDYTNEGIQIIQLQNIGDGEFINKDKIYTSEEKAEELLSANIYPNEIILSKMGDPVARACFIPTNKTNRYLMASDGIRLVVDENRFNKKFVHDYINSPNFRNRAFGVSIGTTRLRIGLPVLKSLKFICPTLPEQNGITQILSDMDAEIAALESQLKKTQNLKQGMMQELLTGKTRLVNPVNQSAKKRSKSISIAAEPEANYNVKSN